MVPLEAEIAKAILRSVEDGSFLDRTQGQEQLRGILENPSNPNVIPTPSVDHLIRRRIAHAARQVLDSLIDLQVISVDRNISGQGGTLRPDVLAFDRTRRRLVCFEFKRASGAAREALTELLAYEQEIRNNLPFTSEDNVVFVIMSTTWSTLLEHAVGGAIVFGNRRVLCLEIDASAGAENLTWRLRLPRAWSLLGGDFPRNAFVATTALLTPADTFSDESSQLVVPIQGLELVARELERSHAHGFALLWKDGADDAPPGRCGLTFVGINPYVFHVQATKHGLTNRASALTAFLGANASFFGETWEPDEVRSTVRRLEDFAGSRFAVTVCAPRPWSELREELRRRAEPAYVESWGIVGEFVRQQVTHTALLRRQLYKNGIFDWRAPSTALNEIDEIDGRRLFRDGFTTCSDAYRFGYLLGSHIRLHAGAALQGADLCEAMWTDIEMIGAIQEVHYLATAAVAVSDPPVQVPIGIDARWEDDAGAAFAEWFRTAFLSGLPPYVDGFDIGYLTGLAPVGYSGVELTEAVRSHTCAFVTAETLGSHLAARSDAVIAAAARARERLALSDGLDLVQAHARLTIVPGADLLAALPDVAKAYDGIFAPHVVAQKSVLPSTPDWDWFQEGIALMIERGVPFPGIALLPNGMLATMPLEQTGLQTFFPPRKSVLDAVLFADFTHGGLSVQETTWEDLRAGKIVPVTP
jgi:hypothetical protein